MDKARIAQEAGSLLDNEVLKMALDAIEKDAIERMIHGVDDDARRNFALEVKAVRDLRTTLLMWKSDVPKLRPAVV